MKTTFKLLIGALLLAAFLSTGACRKGLTPEKDLHDTLNVFMQSLRWGDVHATARFFVDPLDRDYLDRYANREGINVTDVQLADVRISPDGREAVASLQMEYFILPNASVRRIDFNQQWRQAEGGPPGRTLWRLHTAFPNLE